MCCTSPELRSASSYGHFIAAKEFRSQCHILMWSGLIKVKNPCSGFRVPPISGHQTKVKLPHGTARRVQHIDLGAFCVELWSFYCSKRISVPMSYISFWEQKIKRSQGHDDIRQHKFTWRSGDKGASIINQIFAHVPFVIVNRIRQGRSLSRRGVPGHVRVYLDTFGYTSMLSHEIYDIGTEILLLT